MTILDKRLSAIASLVTNGACLCDVGTDHAYLPCFLIENNIARAAVAVDVNQNPLDNARANVEERGLGDRIKVFFSDGLAQVDASVTDIVFAGMGGELIAKLLFAAAWTRDPAKHFLLQPMTQAPFLRLALYREGFSIQRECAVIDHDRFYTVMSVRYTAQSREVDELFSWVGCMDPQDADARRYLQHIQQQLYKMGAGLLSSADVQKRAQGQQKTALAERVATLL